MYRENGKENINLYLRILRNWLSFIVIIATAGLELYLPNIALVRLGYLIGLTLTVLSESRWHVMGASLLISLLIIALFGQEGDMPATPLLFSRIYIGVGLCITVFLVLLAFQRKSKNDDYRSQMAGIFAHGTQGIILTEKQGNIVLVNPYTHQLFGFSGKELIGSNISDILPDADTPMLVRDGANTGVRKDLVARRKDKSCFDVEISMNEYRSSKNTFIVTFVNDITQRKRTEEILMTKGEQLELANRELEAFSYSVSHDLRSPLRAVGGYAQMLEEDYKDVFDAEGRRLLQNIWSSAQRMGLLIDDLLSFSRLGRKDLNKSLVNMRQVTESALDELTHAVNQHLSISVGDLHPAMADASLMARVMINLLSNAIKYSSKVVAPVVEVKSVLTDGQIVYSVRDNGVGFDMKYLSKLFGVFQRLHSDDEFEGTGVGLAIVQRVIHKHGGKVWAEGKEGAGATFFFSLPASQ